MKYSCPACSGEIVIDDYSTATVFVCPHCNFSGNISKLKETSQTVDDSGPAPGQNQPGPGPGAESPGDQALEPITRTTNMKRGDAADRQGPPPASPAQENIEASEGFLKDFEKGNIFSKVEEHDAVPETGSQPPPPGVQQQDGGTGTPAEGAVECPICKSVNQADAVMDSGTFKCTSCGSMFSPEGAAIEEAAPGTGRLEDPVLGQQIGGCKVVSKVGEGGMGAVYEGVQISLERKVAIKILPGQYSRNKSFIQRFEREAKSLAKINHQNIMQIYDFGMHGDLYFMVMEFINGKSLSDMIEERYVLTMEELLPIIKQAAMGLACAQKNGVIHRDVKPDNIMIDAGGTVKMTDFGLAKIVGSGMAELTQEGVRVGTPAFMSPEQCKGEKTLDVRTDIYSLGITFYFALTGKLPFTGDSPFSIMLKHQNQKAEPVKKVVSGIPDAISEIIDKMMEKEPGDRYQTWESFLDAVKAVERFMTVELPDDSGPSDEEKLLKKETMDIDMQQKEGDQEAFGDSEPREGAGAEEEKSGKIAELMIKGDGEFAQNKFEDAINSWQKALFLDPNNIELQDRISEARHRIRHDAIESMLAEANRLEKRRKYRKALQQLDEVSKLKLSWQVKDMVSGSITRIQKKIRKRKAFFSVVRLIILFVCLVGAVVIGYPNLMLLMAQRAYNEAEKKREYASEFIDKDLSKYEQRAREAIKAYENVIRYKVADKGVLGLVFERLGTENIFVKQAVDSKKKLESSIADTREKHQLVEAKEILAGLEKEGKYVRAAQEADRILKEISEDSKYYPIVADIVKRVREKSGKAEALYNRAVSHDIFEMKEDADILKYSSYSEIRKALEYYSELKKSYPGTELADSAKEAFTINTKPEGAAVTVITDKGRKITIRGKTTPLQIPVHKPNRLFSVVITRKGYKKRLRKYRKNTLDKKNETFELEYGPCWVTSTTKQNPLTSFPLVHKKSLILLGHNNLLSVDCETGQYNWKPSNYIQKKTPLVSRFFNNERDIVLYRDNIIVPCINGTFAVVTMSKLQPGEWIKRDIDVRPAHRPTVPCVLKPRMHKGTTGLFFGGGEGEKSKIIGGVSFETGKPLWGTSGDGSAGVDAKKTDIKVLEKEGTGKAVKGNVLDRLIALDSSIVFSTTEGFIYDIDINTGTVKNRLKCGTGKGRNSVQASGGYVYYIESSKDISFVYKINLVTGKQEWQKEVPGTVCSGKPLLYGTKLIFGLSMAARGRCVALSDADGSIAWTYPVRGSISKVTQEITMKDNRLYCAAGTQILILDPDKGTKMFDEYSTELANITEKLLVHNGYIYALTGDGKIYCFMIPDSLAKKK